MIYFHKNISPPGKVRVLQKKHDILSKMKQARKVVRLEGRRHISHKIITEINKLIKEAVYILLT